MSEQPCDRSGAISDNLDIEENGGGEAALKDHDYSKVFSIDERTHR